MQKTQRLKRLSASFYELILLIAIWLIVAGIFVTIFGDAMHGFKRFALQSLLWSVTGAYFVRCWKQAGQTLAMKTWRLKVVSRSGLALTYPQLWLRYALASVGLIAVGAGFFWMLFDREGLCLHDRLTGCKVISVE